MYSAALNDDLTYDYAEMILAGFRKQRVLTPNDVGPIIFDLYKSLYDRNAIVRVVLKWKSQQ